MDNILESKSIKKYYHRGSETVKALDGVDFEIASGEMVAIVGPSGSGKTTLMNIISCLDNPTEGQLKIAGKDVTNYTESQLIKIRRENIGFVFQQFYLIPTLTAKENIELPFVFSKKSIDPQRINTVMERVGIQSKQNIQVNQLSGGDKQRCCLARSLMNDPAILIADEPTGKLETQVRDAIFSLFDELVQSGLAIFIATHDLELAEKTQRIIHLQDGKIVQREESSLYW